MGNRLLSYIGDLFQGRRIGYRIEGVARELRLFRGSPEGEDPGSPGDLRIDPDNGNVWVKKSGVGTVGWAPVATGSATGDLTVDGDLFVVGNVSAGQGDRGELIGGDGTDFTAVQLRKGDANSANWLDLRTGGVESTNRRWLGIWNNVGDNILRLTRRSITGAIVDVPWQVIWDTGEVRMETIANFNRIVSNLGTALVAGDFALSAGWGAGGAVAPPVVPSTDTRGIIEVTPAGAGIAANPTVTLTFTNGAFPSAPVVVASRGDVAAPTAGEWRVTGQTDTTVTFTFADTPISGNVYTLLWHTID